MRVYYTSIEFEFTEEHPESDQWDGGYVMAFVRAEDVQEAMAAYLVGLANYGLEPTDVVFIVPHDEQTQWETPEDLEKFRGLADQAMESGEVVFDDFYTFEASDEA